ncbi:MAG TPA: hypothetical protein VHE53_00815 [Patescibacteria group bacterium]|nr:hypothetical protein [Patescibacteria group bacterium]
MFNKIYTFLNKVQALTLFMGLFIVFAVIHNLFYGFLSFEEPVFFVLALFFLFMSFICLIFQVRTKKVF